MLKEGNKMKRLLSVVLALAMLMMLVPTVVFAEGASSPVNIGNICAEQLSDLEALAASYPSAVQVNTNDDIITIKLLSDITGRIELDIPNADFIFDANGKTFSGENQNEAICLENAADCTVTLTGNGTFSTGRNNTFFVGDNNDLFIESATISGRIRHGGISTVKTVLAAGKACYSVLKNSGLTAIYTEPQNLVVEGSDTVIITQLDVTPALYTVTFDANGHGTAPDALNNVIEGGKIAAPAAPTENGYTFGGWYKEAECQNAWDFDNDTVTEDTTLFAKWTEGIAYKEYVIERYDIAHVQKVLGSGAFVTEKDGKILIILREDLNGRLVFSSLRGGTFEGSFVLNLNGYTIDPGMLNEAIDLYVYFEGDLTITGSGTLKYGKNNTTNTWGQKIYCAVAEGYDYYTLTVNGNDKFDAQNTETKALNSVDYDVVITQYGSGGVNFEDIYDYVEFDSNGGSDIGGITVEAGSKIAAPEAPTKDGYTFCGWYKEETCENEWNFESDTVTESTTLFAKWTEPLQGYTVTFNENGGSVTPANATTEANGRLAALPTPTRSGRYTFKGWYTASSGGTQVTTDTVFDADTTVYAQWAYTGGLGGSVDVSKYTVKFETNGGTAVENKSVTINARLNKPTAPAKDGFAFGGWYTDKELTTAYDFNTKVTSSFTLYAKWIETEKEPQVVEPQTTISFKDIKTDDWFCESVKYVVENKLMNGVAEDKFAPSDNLTRAMLVTILYRNEGEPAANKSIPFADVDMGAYYGNAVSWAKLNGIINGVSETEFAPNSNITREQIAVIMHRYAQYKGMNAQTSEENLHFTDSDEIFEYAVSAMNWAVGKGLIKGRTDTTLNPKDNATRAETAAIIYRFLKADK